MADDKKKFWIKLEKDFMKSSQIKVIKAMANGKDYLLFYLALMLESVESVGHLRFSDLIPYNEEMLASITDTNIDIVRSAIKIFVSLGLIQFLENGTIFLPDVPKRVGKETDSAERVRIYREKEKTKALQCNTDVTKCNDNIEKSREEIEEEKSREKKSKEEIDTNVSLSVEITDFALKNSLFNDILVYWNTYSKLNSIKTITDKRKKHLIARIKEHGEDAIFKVIDNIVQSEFLHGANNRNWIADFDWVFTSPNNFVKVLEGKYQNRSVNSSSLTIEDKYQQKLRDAKEKGRI